jgi:hypothetical protein
MMEAVRTSETSVDNHFTRQYNPEDSSEHHTRRRENLKSHDDDDDDDTECTDHHGRLVNTYVAFGRFRTHVPSGRPVILTEAFVVLLSPSRRLPG